MELVAPEDLEYRNGQLRRTDYNIDLVYRGLQAHEFLLRYDLTHPLVRAYREGKVCVVNSFRTEVTRKRSLFALLTDETVTASFPAEEKKAIRETLPMTRMVAQAAATGAERALICWSSSLLTAKNWCSLRSIA